MGYRPNEKHIPQNCLHDWLIFLICPKIIKFDIMVADSIQSGGNITSRWKMEVKKTLLMWKNKEETHDY